MSRVLRESRGSALVFALLLFPPLLALAGLVIDGALIARQQLNLESAVDAAARAATDAYERSTWESERRVVINPDRATEIAREYLTRNMPSARLADVVVEPAMPNEVRVDGVVDARIAFMRIFGISAKELRAHSVARKW